MKDTHKTLKFFSREELEAELQRRNYTRPEVLHVVDWEPVMEYVDKAVNKLNNEGCLPKDFEHYLMESALETMYGPDIWDWWNSKLKGE